MTPPARSTAPAQKAAPAAPRGTARWLNIVTTLALGTALLVVAFAAAPSLVRAAVHAQEEEPAFPPPVRAPHLTIVPRDHAAHGIGLAPGDDDPDDPEPPLVHAPHRPGDPRLPPRAPAADDRDEPGGLGLGLKTGITAKPLRLRDRRTNTVMEEFGAGTEVSVLRDDGEWVLIVRRSDGDLVTGWARKSELVFR